MHFDTLSSLSSLVCPVFLLEHRLIWKNKPFGGRKRGGGKNVY